MAHIVPARQYGTSTKEEYATFQGSETPKAAQIGISLHDTRILRILVEDEGKESINEGKGKEFRRIIYYAMRIIYDPNAIINISEKGG